MVNKLKEIKDMLINDKRRSDRLKLDVKAFYRLKKETNWKELPEIKNLSGNGLNFTVGRKLETGDKIDIKLILPEEAEHPVIAEGKIIWCNKEKENPPLYSSGIDFVKMDPLSRKKFIFYISESLLVNNLT